MRIGIDLDGVITNFIRAYENLIIETTGKNLFPGLWPNPLPPTWDWPQHYGYTADEIKQVWGVIKSREDFWFNLEAIPGAIEFLERLYDAHPDAEFYYVTDRVGILPQHQSSLWLIDQGLTAPSVIVSARKGDVCNALGIDYYIDDKLQNVQDVIAKSPNTTVRLLNFPYNQSPDVPPAYRINSLEEFEAIIKG